MTPRNNQVALNSISHAAVDETPRATITPRKRKHLVEVHRVPIDALQQANSPRRNGIDPEHVKVLCEQMDELPPILVHRPTMKVIDGMHRLHAAHLLAHTAIDAVYFDGSEEEAFLISVESNVKHGLPLSLNDRKEAALRILHNFPRWSNRSIAARVGLDHKTVGAIRLKQQDPNIQSSARVGLDGRVRPLSPAEGRLRACEVIISNPQASLRDIARSAGISVETARDVRKEMRHESIQMPCDADSKAESASVTTAITPPKQPDVTAVLDSLKKDPAIRYSIEGRALVRWLDSRLISKDDADRLLHIPAHQAAKVATLARAIAACWSEIATRQESRACPRP